MKKFLTLLLVSFVVTSLFSLEISRSELESAGDEATVIFENYSGPHDIINTIEEITAIGSDLAKPVSDDLESAIHFGDKDKYYVIHAVDPTVKNGLDADILVFGEDALVDHIDNVRRVIEGFLQTAYGLNKADAKTIAIFTTVYNAVHHQDLENFTDKYKPVVTENLTKDKVGLSLNYSDWPGKTQIVIPLSSLDGGLGTVDTTEISDKDVVDALQKEPDKGIDERKDLVEIKEKESEIAEEKAQEAQKKATETKVELEEKKDELKEAEKKLEDAKEELKENPEDKEAQQKVEEAKEKVGEKEQVVEEKKEEIRELQEEAKEEQKKSDTKRADAQSDRVEIAEDQQVLIDEQIEDEVLDLTYGLKIVDDRSLMSSLVLIDTSTGTVVKESPVDVIRNRVIYSQGNDYIAVAGKTSGNAAVRLVKLDGLSMEIIQQSVETLAVNSMLAKDGDSYFAIVEDEKGFLLAKYNANLEKVGESSITVRPETPITVTEKGVIVNSKDGSILLLDKDNLQTITG